MNYTLITYGIYLVASIGITLWVGKKLFTNGRIFLVDIFKNNTELADSVNNILLVGFYLINIGFMIYTLKLNESILNAQMMIEILSVKLGIVILILGGMHFFNLFVLISYRNNNKKEQCSTKTQ